MKVLAVMGSPRKGDSYRVTKQVEAEMKKIGDVEFEYLFLKDADLQPCRGCFNCIAKGKEHCPLKDDRPLIEDKILQADGVIFASPGYVMNISALMKNFIERFAYTFHRPQFFGQKALLITTGGPRAASMAMKCLTELEFAGFNVIHKLVMTVMPWPTGQVQKSKAEKDVKIAARKFYDSLQKQTLPVPALDKVISFNFFKQAARETKEFLTADYSYYKDLKDYYYPVKISMFKKVAAFFLTRFSFLMMRDLGPDVKVKA